MKLERTLDLRPFILDWAAQVKQRMVSKKWNLRQLAQEVNKSPQFLSQLLNGYSHGSRRPVMPSYELVEALDRTLGYPKEQQYQALGLSNHIGLGSSEASDLVKRMQSSHSEHERQLQLNSDQRLRQLEEQVLVITQRLGIDISDLTGSR